MHMVLYLVILGVIGQVIINYTKSKPLIYVFLLIFCAANFHSVLNLISSGKVVGDLISIGGFAIITMIIFEISRAYFDNALHYDISPAAATYDIEEKLLEYYAVTILFYSALFFIFLLYIIPLGYSSLFYLSSIMLYISITMLGNSIVRLWTFEILIVIYVLFLVGALLIELIEFSYYMDILISYVFLVLFYFDLKALIKKTVDRKISSRKVLRKLYDKHDQKD
ncbi:hypothetical protein [Methanothermococcus thermolithotrophicus]|uniref:hypothetical protein n=1 Tax=Methanothermococcus thermolithotrophicus TaxID=2186 RepID=UPI0003604785|nr:hypothetical protein [Methanothermococcus thermolithotrophicus]